MKKYFENDDLLAIFWRWKKPLSIVFVLTVLLSLIVSSPLFIAPKFKSFARVYPSNLVSYSEESYSEQMLQLLESDAIRDKLIKEFNLAKHYEIDEDDDHKVDKLFKQYAENVQFNKTKFESVEIEVVDENPDTAYALLNRLIKIYNEEVKIIQDTQLKEAVQTLKNELSSKEAEMDTLEKQIDYLRANYNMLDYKAQVKSISKAYYKLLASPGGNSEKLKKVKQELDQLKSKGSEYERLAALLYSVRGEYARIKIQYDSQYKELLREKQYANVIVNGYKSDKKVYPVRWMIVSLSVVSVMFIAFSLVSFLDRANREQNNA